MWWELRDQTEYKQCKESVGVVEEGGSEGLS